MNKNKLNQSKMKSQRNKTIVLTVAIVFGVSLLIFGKGIFSPKTEKISTENEIVLNSENFDEVVLKSDKLVMVDFWATWCRPCKMIAPSVSELAKQYEGKIVVGKVDVDQNQELSVKYKIEGIPAILFFKNGQLVDQIVGFVEKEELENKIKINLK